MAFFRRIRNLISEHVLLSIAVTCACVIGVLLLNLVIISISAKKAAASEGPTKEWLMTKKSYSSAQGSGSLFYEYDNAGRVIKCTAYDADGIFRYTENWQYDSKGNMIKYTCDNPEVAGSVAELSYKYEYNDKGNLSKVYYMSESGLWYVSTKYKYDKNGNVIQKTEKADQWSESDYYTYEYDAFNNPVKESIFYGDNEAYGEEYELDSNGVRIKGKYVSAEEEILEDGIPLANVEPERIAMDSKYNSSKNIMVVTHYNYQGIVCGKSEYNTAGNLIKESTIEVDGIISLWTEYQYDAYGNLLKKIQYYAGGKVLCSEEYEYMYVGIK